MTMAFPKPGRALLGAMAAMGVLGVLTAFLVTWVPGGAAVFNWLGCRLDVALSQPWRLVTSGLLTDPEHWSHLLFSLVGLYFLGAPLEKRWGGWRFARFLAVAIVFGNLTTLAMDKLVPLGAPRFHPELVFGPTAAIAAIAIAWSREYAQSTVHLFFFVPLRGTVFFWMTIGFCVLDLIYPAPMPEGVFAPFGGVVAGLLFSGSPSIARRAWLQVRLALLRRRSSSLQASDLLAPGPKRQSRQGAPPLRVVSGGMEDLLKKRSPPKDKRYLN